MFGKLDSTKTTSTPSKSDKKGEWRYVSGDANNNKRVFVKYKSK